MTQAITIGSVTLVSDLKWIDEFGQGSDLVGQIETVSSTGALIIQASAQQAGRLMTLQTVSSGPGFGSQQYAGVLTRAQVTALKALADVPGATYAVVLNDGRTFNAMFRRANTAAVVADPIIFYDPLTDTDWYSVTINLILV